MELNADKCNEMCIDFKRNTHNFPPIVINGKELSVSNSVKILGVTISSDLKSVSYTHLTLPTIYSV